MPIELNLQSITEINLDIGNEPGVTVVPAKQYDTARTIKAHLFDNAIRWEVPEGRVTAMVSYKKSDRIGGFYDMTELGEIAITIDGNDRSIIYFILDRQLLTTVGPVNTEITFYETVSSEISKKLTTFSFTVDVRSATLTELDLSSNPRFDILARDIAAVLNAEEKFKGLSATANTVLPVEDGGAAKATFTGGVEPGEPFVLSLDIPQGNTGNAIIGNEIHYAVNTNPNTIPSSGWVSNITQLTIPDGAIVWTRVKQSFSKSSASTWYAKAVQGSPGPAGVAVQDTEPVTNVKVWINPDEQQYITIPELSECNPIHFTATIGQFPYTINDARITPQMRVVSCAVDHGENLISSITWSTETAGRLVLNGTLVTGQSITLDLDVQQCVS